MNSTDYENRNVIIEPGDLRRDGRPSRAEFQVMAGVIDAHTATISGISITQAKMSAIVWGIVKKLGITPEELQSYCDDMAAQVKTELEKKNVAID